MAESKARAPAAEGSAAATQPGASATQAAEAAAIAGPAARPAALTWWAHHRSRADDRDRDVELSRGHRR